MYRNLKIGFVFLVLSSCFCSNCISQKRLAQNGITNLGISLKESINRLTDSTNKTLRFVDTTILNELDSVLKQIIVYLEYGIGNTTEHISKGTLKGSIGYINQTKGIDTIALQLDHLIHYTAGPAREELIQLKNSLLDITFQKQLKQSIRIVREEALIATVNELEDAVLGQKNQARVSGMLRLLIPSMLNDSAIRQIGLTKDTLLGKNTQHMVANLMDTSLGVFNKRLDNDFLPKIEALIKKTKNDASEIVWIWVLGAALIAVAVFAFIYYKKHDEKDKMLFQVAYSIEKGLAQEPKGKLPIGHEEDRPYHKLSKSIYDSMMISQLEPEMKKFLEKKAIKRKEE